MPLNLLEEMFAKTYCDMSLCTIIVIWAEYVYCELRYKQDEYTQSWKLCPFYNKMDDNPLPPFLRFC